MDPRRILIIEEDQFAAAKMQRKLWRSRTG